MPQLRGNEPILGLNIEGLCSRYPQSLWKVAQGNPTTSRRMRTCKT
jgi:hypothetical protein